MTSTTPTERSLGRAAAAAQPPLAYSRPELADLLGISPRLLDQETKLGNVPSKKVGGRVVYPVRAIERWLDEDASVGPTQPQPSSPPRGNRRGQVGRPVAAVEPIERKRASGPKRPVRPEGGAAG